MLLSIGCLYKYATKEDIITIAVINTAFKNPINSFISSILAINNYTIKKIKNDWSNIMFILWEKGWFKKNFSSPRGEDEVSVCGR